MNKNICTEFNEVNIEGSITVEKMLSFAIGWHHREWAVNTMFEHSPPSISDKIQSVTHRHELVTISWKKQPSNSEIAAINFACEYMMDGQLVLHTDIYGNEVVEFADMEQTA